jgi:hypothetical protein
VTEDELRELVIEVVDEFSNRLMRDYYFNNQPEIDQHAEWIVEMVMEARRAV